MMTDAPDTDPERALCTFLAGIGEALHVTDDGLAPGHSIEVIDVMATLAEAVKRLCADERTPAS
jgi:hypothetical protein